MQHDKSARRKSTGQDRPLSERDQRGRFQTGNIGGPGRPLGSRNSLGGDFVAAVHADWQTHGAAVLERVRKTSPAAYLRVVASLVPREILLDTRGGPYPDLSNEELIALLDDTLMQLKNAKGNLD
jgi:hypothetical protein